MSLPSPANNATHPAAPDTKAPTTTFFNYDQLLSDLHSGGSDLTEYMYFMRQRMFYYFIHHRITDLKLRIMLT